jgi:predicted  nucleic acid-binding Zn-ribbon protein
MDKETKIEEHIETLAQQRESAEKEELELNQRICLLQQTLNAHVAEIQDVNDKAERLARQNESLLTQLEGSEKCFSDLQR